MKKKIATAVIAAMLAGTLWGCGAGSGQQEATVQTQEAGAQVDMQAGQQSTAADAQTADGQQSTAADAQTQNSGSVLPAVVFTERNLWETEDDNKTIASGFYNTVKLTEEAAAAYPALNKTLAAQSSEIENRYDTSFEELGEAAETFWKQKNVDEKDFPRGSLEGQLEVVRCDASVLSLMESTYSFYPGSAHGSTTYRGYNYDAASGEAVKLSDVFADPSALSAVVAGNLKIQADGSPYEEAEEDLRQYFDGTQAEPAWVIDEQGVTFLFAPSELAPYAAGTLEAKISFTDNASLFTDKYGPSEGTYVRKLSADVPFTVDLDGDGVKETLTVVYDYEDGGDLFEYNGFKVFVDDSECVVDQYIYKLNAYLIHKEDGQNYIYVVTHSDNDYENLNVFVISDKKASSVGILSGTGFGSEYHEVYDDGKFDSEKSYTEIFPLIDTEAFALDTRMNLMSTYSASRSYRVGNDGMPEPLTDYYEIQEEHVLTSKVPISVGVVDTKTGEGTGEQKELPAGSKCRMWHTNGESTVDLMLEDGSAVRVHVVADGWPQTVNGIELEEAFDGVMFAG